MEDLLVGEIDALVALVPPNLETVAGRVPRPRARSRPGRGRRSAGQFTHGRKPPCPRRPPADRDFLKLGRHETREFLPRRALSRVAPRTSTQTSRTGAVTRKLSSKPEPSRPNELGAGSIGRSSRAVRRTFSRGPDSAGPRRTRRRLSRRRSPSKDAQSATSWMWRTLPQEKMPGTDVIKRLVDDGAAGERRQLDPGPLGKLVLRDEADREKQRVAGDLALGPGDGSERGVDPGDDHGRDAVAAPDLDDRASKARGGSRNRCRHWRTFRSRPLGQGRISKTPLHAHPLERQAAGHDQADVARAEDDGVVADPEVLEIDQVLGASRP